MGLDLRTAEFLIHCLHSGVQFVETLTLGRQSLYLLPSEARVLRRWTGIDLSRDDFGDAFFQRLGADRPHAMDASAYEGADIIHNLNDEMPETLQDRFDCVIDGGTLEHIFDFPMALRGCMKLPKVGGHMIVLSMANNCMGHGFYQFSPELFFSAFCPENGYKLRHVFLYDGRKWYEPLDPAVVGRRVQAITHAPTLIFVCAQRISRIEPFSAPPHQSDYRHNLVASEETPPQQPSNPRIEVSIVSL